METDERHLRAAIRGRPFRHFTVAEGVPLSWRSCRRAMDVQAEGLSPPEGHSAVGKLLDRSGYSCVLWVRWQVGISRWPYLPLDGEPSGMVVEGCGWGTSCPNEV